MLYNPFEQVTKSSFRELIESGYADFVLQRFEWPDVKEKTGFLLTPYDDKETTDQHAHQLGAKEGRALQLPQDGDKIYEEQDFANKMKKKRTHQRGQK